MPYLTSYIFFFFTFFRFVFYISVVCDNAIEGKKSLQAAIDDLFSLHSDETESKELKPTLLWSALYIQDLIEVCLIFLLFLYC